MKGYDHGEALTLLRIPGATSSTVWGQSVIGRRWLWTHHIARYSADGGLMLWAWARPLSVLAPNQTALVEVT